MNDKICLVCTSLNILTFYLAAVNLNLIFEKQGDNTNHSRKRNNLEQVHTRFTSGWDKERFWVIVSDIQSLLSPHTFPKASTKIKDNSNQSTKVFLEGRYHVLKLTSSFLVPNKPWINHGVLPMVKRRQTCSFSQNKGEGKTFVYRKVQ